MEKTTKVTKKDRFNELLAIEAVAANEALVEFINKEIAAIDAKAAKAKERAAEKKADGDALRETVFGVLTTDAQPIDDIVAAIADEDVTKAKVTARLTQLVKAEKAVKEEVKVGDRKVMAYRLA